MGMAIFSIVIVIVGCTIYAISKIREAKAKQIQEDIDLLSTVTSLSRGTYSERDLVLTLLKYGIRPNAIFHDLYILKPNGTTAQVDIVVATSVGIIVFEVKDYSGWLYGKGNQQEWTQVLSYGREKYRFYNPVLQNKSHIKQLQRILKEDVPFYSVIVFYGYCNLEDISFIPQNTFVTMYYRVIEVVENILQNNPVANYKDKHNVIKVLREAVSYGDNSEIEEKHILDIKDMLGEDRIFR